MGKITGWHAGDATRKSDTENLMDKARDQVRDKSIVDYGRPDIPSYLQREAESYALRKQVSNRMALEALIAEAGSFETLLTQVSNMQRKSAKKLNKKARERAEVASRPKTPPSQLQRAIDASKSSKYVSIVLGGAPGLGKKA